jgi:hypothetical protein
VKGPNIVAFLLLHTPECRIQDVREAVEFGLILECGRPVYVIGGLIGVFWSYSLE